MKNCCLHHLFLTILLLSPLLGEAQRFELSVMALPSRISPGEWTRIQVQTTGENGEPLTRVNVTLQAAGGLFAASRKRIVTGETDMHGLFVVDWTCDPCEKQYLIEIIAEKIRLGKVGDSIRIDVDRPPVREAPSYHLSVTPSEAVPGEPVVVRVSTFRDTLPVSNVKIELSASGGQFTAPEPSKGVPNYVLGYTNEEGILEAVWKCVNCAKTYDFVMRMTAPGSPPLRGETSVTIGRKSNLTGVHSGIVRGRLDSCDHCDFVQVRATPLRSTGDGFSVQVSPDCRYQLSLAPGVYYLEPVWLKKKILGERILTPERLKINVSIGMETVVNFGCREK